MRVPKSLCKKCPHLHDGICDLEDLEPCRYIDAGADRDARIYIACCIIIVVAFLLLSVLVGCAGQEPPKEEYHWSAVELLKEYHGQKEELTEFQMLTMAIALTESRFREDAVGTAGDSGVLQIRECYINEVNRLRGTDYTIEDAFDIGKSIEIFNQMQEAKNPSRNIDTAIWLHNKNANYRQTVLRNLEEIKRYEKVRKELVK